MIKKTHKDWPHAGPLLAGWIDTGGALIILAILQRHLAAHLHDAKLVRKLVRTIAMVSKEAWHQAQHNINLQIREFMLSCPKRRAFVRSVIGEAAIKRWQIRDKNSFKVPADKPERTKAKPRKTRKPYKWKPYALPEIYNLFNGVDFGFPAFPDIPELPPFPEFPRAGRGFQPTVFYLRELSCNYEHIRETPKPIRAVQARKAERLRANFRAQRGWPPAVKDEAQHNPRVLANARYKPP